MAKNQSLPGRLQEKDSYGDHDLIMYEHHEKPTVWCPRPSLSNPRSINDIVWTFLRANPTLLWVVTNCVLTVVKSQPSSFPKRLLSTNQSGLNLENK